MLHFIPSQLGDFTVKHHRWNIPFKFLKEIDGGRSGDDDVTLVGFDETVGNGLVDKI